MLCRRDGLTGVSTAGYQLVIRHSIYGLSTLSRISRNGRCLPVRRGLPFQIRCSCFLRHETPHRRSSRLATALLFRRIWPRDPDSLHFDASLNCSDAEGYVVGSRHSTPSSFAHLPVQCLLLSLFLGDNRVLAQSPMAICRLATSDTYGHYDATCQCLRKG